VSKRRPPSPFGHQPRLDITALSNHMNNNIDDNGASATSKDDDWLSLDPNDLSVGERYGFFISAVVPRPVAVITTQSFGDDGVVNCAPFSYTSLSSHDPPIVTHGIAVTEQGTKKKDTLVNIEATGEWVMNILTKPYLTQANDCAATFPPDQDETVAMGLRTLPCDSVQVPRLEQAAVALECRLWDTKEVFNDQGVHTTTIVMGRVVRIHVHASVLKERETTKQGDDDDVVEIDQRLPPLVDLFKLQAVGRAGDITYWPVGISDPEQETLPMPRPK
jgi:flavin reductase (DIM6/NTAB) family NADH-FMN oxidoreductase RutF